MTVCTGCGGSSWKIEEIVPSGARFKYYAIQCMSCGGPAGIMDYDNIGAAIGEIEQKLDIIDQNVGSLATAINQLLRK